MSILGVLQKLFLISLFLFSLPVYAGGPFTVTSEGDPAKWDGSITLHVDNGTCANTSRGDMVSKLETLVQHWEDITGVDLTFILDTSLITTDITSSNYTTYYSSDTTESSADDDINPVIFDDDGEITDSIFGVNSNLVVLGFAGPAAFSDDGNDILEGQAVLNCLCYDGSTSCPLINFEEETTDATIVHEIGHLIGLDHSAVNQILYDIGCDVLTSDDCDELPTMFPVIADGEDQVTPGRDDEVALLSLYGESELNENWCTVTGTVLDAEGNELRCADIHAEVYETCDIDADDSCQPDVEHTIAFVSGALATLGSDSSCSSGCGDFVLKGLDPNKTYKIKVKPIDSQWVNGSGINPCNSSQNEDVVEEFIATVESSDCSAGNTVALGELTTTTPASSSDDSPDDSSGGSTDDSSGGSSSADSDLDSLISCALNSNLNRPSLPSFLIFMISYLSVILVFRRRITCH